MGYIEEDVYNYLNSVANETGYNRNGLMKAAYMESTFGTNMGKEADTYYGLMQSSKELAKEYGIDRGDAAYYYGDVVSKNLKNSNMWLNEGLNDVASNLEIDRDLLEYMSWQQGRGGEGGGLSEVLSILSESSLEGGIHDNNLTSGQRKKLMKNTKSWDRGGRIDELKKMSDLELSHLWLNDTKEKWNEADWFLKGLDDKYGGIYG